MDNLSGYAHRPFPFVLRYLRKRVAAHTVILIAVVAAVACSVGTQYGVKSLVDSLSAGPAPPGSVWVGFCFFLFLVCVRKFPLRGATLGRGAPPSRGAPGFCAVRFRPP